MGRLLILFLLIFTMSANAAMLDNALALFAKGDYATALDHFESLQANHPDDPDINFYYGRSLYLNRDLERAKDVLEQNIEKHPDHAESHYVLGSVLLTLVSEVNVFRKPGLAKRAVSAWERTVELNPNHHEALYGVVTFYLSAPGIAGGDVQKGKVQLKALESLNEPWADLTEASLYARKEEIEKAEKYFNDAIRGIPDRAFPTLMLANLYATAERFEQALATLEEYKNRTKTWNDPGAAQTALVAARIYEGLEQTEKAKQAYQTVISSVATNPEKERAKDALEKLQSR